MLLTCLEIQRYKLMEMQFICNTSVSSEARNIVLTV